MTKAIKKILSATVSSSSLIYGFSPIERSHFPMEKLNKKIIFYFVTAVTQLLYSDAIKMFLITLL